MSAINTVAKGVLLVVGVYIVTVGVVVFTSIALMTLIKPHSYKDMSRALLVLWRR